MRIVACIMAVVATFLPAMTFAGTSEGKASYRDAGLSDAQWKQLKDLDVLVVLPTALPAGFRVASVQVGHMSGPQNHRGQYTVTYSNGKQTFVFHGSPLGEAGNDPDPSLYFRNPSPVLGPPALNTDGVCYGTKPVGAVGNFVTMVRWGPGILSPYYYNIVGCQPSGDSAVARATALDPHVVAALWSSARVIGGRARPNDVQAEEAAAMQDLVREFYHAWNAHKFSYAYSFLSHDYQAAHPYNDWLKSHQTVERIDVQPRPTREPLVAAFVVHSTDRIEGKQVHSTFSGTWRGVIEGSELRLTAVTINGGPQ
ncbi:MAG: hypothetical protein JO060_07180 [Candidatus Eremiobacteraeota bacterium]|nr:hypothetical protein [Candidatus Eremiobacteraeota bacterium]